MEDARVFHGTGVRLDAFAARGNRGRLRGAGRARVPPGIRTSVVRLVYGSGPPAPMSTKGAQ